MVTTKAFYRGDFLLEYIGEKITEEEGERREKTYASAKNFYLYFFNNGKKVEWYVCQDFCSSHVNFSLSTVVIDVQSNLVIMQLKL